jgi:riboflavin kinase/FMN adenylyltransferase
MPLAVAYSIEEAARLAPRASAVTLGVFDGVHRGHRRIVEETVALREAGTVERAFLLTFDPHPAVVTHSREAPPILTTIEERLELLESFALDGVVVVPFDERTSRVEYREFVDRYLLGALDMRRLVLGYDCHFGHRREGSPARAAAYGRERGFDVSVVPAVSMSDHVVSSTEIRNALLGGDLARANELLGHAYLVAGTVVQGQGRGSDLGFPTANLAPPGPAKLWPPQGVYAVTVGWSGRRFDGMMNVGRAPTVKGGEPGIEVHIFDFDHTLYGERLSVYCQAYLREERAFPGLDALIDQLAADREAAREALAAARAEGP